MPRQPRIVVPGGLYHVTARGNRRQPVFADDLDRTNFLVIFATSLHRLSWICHGYCLMPNHVHLVLEVPNADLSAGMQAVESRYAERFNRRHGLDGHLFQGRFHASVVKSDWHFIELARYLALNPVKAGLCSAAAEWEWGSYQPYAGIAPVPEFLTVGRLLAFFGPDLRRARTAYRAFVLDGMRTF